MPKFHDNELIMQIRYIFLITYLLAIAIGQIDMNNTRTSYA